MKYPLAFVCAVLSSSLLGCAGQAEDLSEVDEERPSSQGASLATGTSLAATVTSTAVVVEGTLSMPAISYCGCGGGGEPQAMEPSAAPAALGGAALCDGTNFFHLDLRKDGWSNSAFTGYPQDCALCNRTYFYQASSTTYVAGRSGEQSATECAPLDVHIKYTFPRAAGGQSTIPDEDLSDGAQDYILYNFLAGQSSYPGFGAGDYTVVFLPWFTGKAPGCNTTEQYVYGPSGSTTFTINGPSPAVQAVVTGPTSALKPQTCSYTATASGFTAGSGKSYLWEVSSSAPGTGAWSGWSTARSFTTTSNTDSRSFTMPIADIRQRVTVTSNGVTAVSPIFYTWYDVP